MKAWKKLRGKVWHALWWERDPGKGRKKRMRSLRTEKEARATEKLEELNSLLDAQKYGYRSVRMSWKSFCEDYKRLTKPEKSADTRLRDRQTIARFNVKVPVFWLQNLSPVALSTYIAGRENDGVAHSTINRDLTTLKHMTAKAVEWGYLRHDPWKSIRKFTVDEPEASGFTEEQKNEIREYCGDAYERALHETFVLAGLRPGEAARLKWDDLNFKTLDIFVRPHPGLRKNPKKRVRHLPMHPDAARAYRDLRKESTDDGGYIFGQWGEPQTARYLSRIYKKLLKRCALDLGGNSYKGRHTYGSDLVNQGQDSRIIQLLMGHSRGSTTEKYTHPHAEAKRRAVFSLPGSKWGSRKKKSSS